MKSAEVTPWRSSIRNHLHASLGLVLFLVAGVGFWAAAVPLSGAVLANGMVAAESEVKRVQHPDGGVVERILIEEGTDVAAGQLLVQLDGTQIRANLAIVEKQLAQAGIRHARLVAEREHREQIETAQDAGMDARGIDLDDMWRSEARLFEARRLSRLGAKAQLRERIAQADLEIAGMQAQIDAMRKEVAVIEAELRDLELLRENSLAPVTRINILRRELAEKIGEIGSLQASTARTRGRIAETELQILQIDNDLQAEVAADLREVEASTGEYSERRIAALDRLQRTAVRAPQAGIVHNLSVHSAGEVIGAGEKIMEIVPVSDRMVAEVRISPADIDQIEIGQPARLRFSAFSQTATPEISGQVVRMGADLTIDPYSGLRYYLVRIATAEDKSAALGRRALIPGMPVEAFIRTQNRTALSYLVKPLADQFQRAFREE